MTNTQYRTILADPPWDIHQRGTWGAAQHYPLMSLDRICALGVEQLAAPDAHLWLWVTNGSLPVGREVMTAWGFTYRSCLTWVKPRLGLGQYLRNQTEHLLLGTRGRAPVRFRCQGSWFYAPQQEHSHKPEEQYAIIERCSAGPYLELFARRRVPGWDAWGNEVDSDVPMSGTRSKNHQFTPGQSSACITRLRPGRKEAHDVSTDAPTAGRRQARRQAH